MPSSSPKPRVIYNMGYPCGIVRHLAFSLFFSVRCTKLPSRKLYHYRALSHNLLTLASRYTMAKRVLRGIQIIHIIFSGFLSN